MSLPTLSRTAIALLTVFVATAVVSDLRAQRMVVAEPQARPVVVESADIRTEVTGRVAVTTFDLVFRNPNTRVLEGTFEFPLLEGQTVVGFALDIGGVMRHAVPVNKDKGRVVFEEIERRQIDPGLLEKTEGNNYRARVFPIPASGTRRIAITYQEDVARASDATYRLALAFPELLKRFHLTVVAHTGGTELPRARTTLPLELPAWHDAKTIEVTRTDFEARGVLELSLPRAMRPQLVTERRGDVDYFYAEVPVAPSKPVSRDRPRAIGLLWDASGSARDHDHVRELALLDAWFAAVPDVEVKLVLLRDHASAPQPFSVRGGDWRQLRQELERVVYDGATSFDGIVDDAAVGEWLLFSDGLINYGTGGSSAALPLRAPVHVINAAVQSDTARLRGIALKHRGEYVNLLETPASDAVVVLRSESLRVLGLERNPEQLAQIFPERNTPVSPGVLVVTGQLRTRQAALRLKIGHNDSDAVTIELPLKKGENAGGIAARAWAATKVAALQLEPAANREDIRRTSQEFGIVTSGTSLIVLETVQDYVQYDISPPEELKAEWETLRGRAAAVRTKNTAEHLDDIAARFKEQRKWWEKKFPKDEPKPEYRDRAKAVTTLGPTGGGGGALPQRPAPASDGDVVELSPFTVASGQDRRARERRVRGPELEARAALNTYGAIGGAAGSVSTSSEDSVSSSISLQRWESKAGYLDRLKRAAAHEQYEIYLEERSAHARQPGFYLDVAEFFLSQKKDNALGLRVLSNLAELQLEDAALLRVLGYRLVQAGRPDLARPLFERVLVIRPEEPQSKRDLALVCAGMKEYQRAIELLWDVVSEPWHDRFPDIEMIALGELNAIVDTCGESLDISRVDRRLRRNLPVGLRAVLTWDADACDIDLWVDDPNGERAYYSNALTYQGGRMSRDFTGGYGPEEFLLRDPKPGKYVVRINYFGDRRQTALGPVTAQVHLITGFGTPSEKAQRLTVRLTTSAEQIEIGTIEIK